VAESRGPLGPIASAREPWLRAQGRLAGDGAEVLVVIEAVRQPSRGSRSVVRVADSPTFSTTR
jgi:hypothetical protein